MPIYFCIASFRANCPFAFITALWLVCFPILSATYITCDWYSHSKTRFQPQSLSLAWWSMSCNSTHGVDGIFGEKGRQRNRERQRETETDRGRGRKRERTEGESK